MYLKHFGIDISPFSATPDPRFIHFTPKHREALAHLTYALTGQGGFVLLTGEVGTGKTTVCRHFLKHLPEHVEAALCLNPRLEAAELLASICDDFGIDRPNDATSPKALVDALSTHLLTVHSEGRRAVLLIDEAQNLSPMVLEQIRLLTNLETEDQKLLHVVLVGQPELEAMLRAPNLRQVSQRITARYHIAPLNFSETTSLISYRLSIAGLNADTFSRAARLEIYRRSRGIPRLITNICERCLLGAYTAGRHRVTWPIAWRAGRELTSLSARRLPNLLRPLAGAAGAVALLMLMVFGLGLWPSGPRDNSVATDGDMALARTPASDAQPMAIPNPNPLALRESYPIPPMSGAPANNDSVLHSLMSRASDSAAFDAGRAHRKLFHLWGVKTEEIDQAGACELARQIGLRCMSQRGTWETLKHLNRPVVLTLELGGAPAYVAISAIAGNVAWARMPEGETAYTLAELDAHWAGDYFLLWRPPPGYAQALARGHAGPPVMWLHTQLNVLPGQTDARPKLTGAFSRATHRQVLRFQVQNDLTADGIAGPVTIIALNTLNDPAVPRLLATAAPR